MFAVFSTPVYTGSDFAYYTFTKAENRKSYETFIEAVKERSFYDTGITADYGEKLLTLSTCEYSQEKRKAGCSGKENSRKGDNKIMVHTVKVKREDIPKELQMLLKNGKKTAMEKRSFPICRRI